MCISCFSADHYEVLHGNYRSHNSHDSGHHHRHGHGSDRGGGGHHGDPPYSHHGHPVSNGGSIPNNESLQFCPNDDYNKRLYHVDGMMRTYMCQGHVYDEDGKMIGGEYNEGSVCNGSHSDYLAIQTKEFQE